MMIIIGKNFTQICVKGTMKTIAVVGKKKKKITEAETETGRRNAENGAVTRLPLSLLLLCGCAAVEGT